MYQHLKNPSLNLSTKLVALTSPQVTCVENKLADKWCPQHLHMETAYRMNEDEATQLDGKQI